MDLKTAVAYFGPPVGIVLGWALSLVTAHWERDHASRLEVRRRKEESAKLLDGDIFEAMRRGPSGVVSLREARDRLWPILGEIQVARARYAVLDDPEIERRYRCLDMAIFMAIQATGDPEDTLNLYALDIAREELRQALVAYQNREEPPPAEFPQTDEMIRLVHAGGRAGGFEALNRYLSDRGAA